MKSEVWVGGAVHRREKFKVVHVGNSFVKQGTQAMLKLRRSRFSESQFMEVSQPQYAEILADQYKIKSKVNFMYTVSKDIVLFEDIWANMANIKKFSPDFVLVNIGSNDLAELNHSSWRSGVRELVENCIRFAAAFDKGVTVAFLEVIPRIKFEGDLMPNGFERRAKLFNDLLWAEQGKALRQRTNLRFGKIQGLRNKYNSNGEHKKRNIEEFLADGVHPNFEMYRGIFAKSIRKAILGGKNAPARQ